MAFDIDPFSKSTSKSNKILYTRCYGNIYIEGSNVEEATNLETQESFAFTFACESELQWLLFIIPFD